MEAWYPLGRGSYTGVCAGDTRGNAWTVDDAPQYLAQQVKDALCSDERVAALDIHVRIVDADVYLQGQVATEDRRGCAETIAAELLPDHRIHNDIRVLTVLDAADEEHLA